MTLKQEFERQFNNFFQNNLEQILGKISKIEQRRGAFKSHEDMVLQIKSKMLEHCYNEIYILGELFGYKQDLLDPEVEIDEETKKIAGKIIFNFFYIYRDLFSEVNLLMNDVVNSYDELEAKYLQGIERANENNYNSLSKRVDSLIQTQSAQEDDFKINSHFDKEKLKKLVVNTCKEMKSHGENVTEHGLFKKLKKMGYELSQNSLGRLLGKDELGRIINMS